MDTNSSSPNESPQVPHSKVSLRGLFVLLTLFSCALGWVSWRIHRGAAQQAAVARLRDRATVSLTYDWQAPVRGATKKAASAGPPASQWLIENLGEDTFQTVTNVYLTALCLDETTRSDISALADLPSIETLEIRDKRRLVSVAPIGSLRNLKHLALGSCQFDDPNSLSKLTKLESFKWKVTSDSIDLSFLSPWKELKRLRLSRVPSESKLAAIANLQSLETLELTFRPGEGPRDLAMIASLANLKELTLDCSGELDLAPIGTLQQLGGLTLKHQNGTKLDISSFQNLKNLEKLDLFAPVQSASPLGHLKKLKSLRLTFGASDVSVLRKSTGIERLTVAAEPSDVAWLGELHALKQLTVRSLHPNGTEITDLSFLQSLPHLKDLSLSGFSATDWSILATLNDLENLGVNEGNFQDASVLESLPRLKALVISQIDQPHLFGGLTSLETLEVIDAWEDLEDEGEFAALDEKMNQLQKLLPSCEIIW